MDHRFVQQVFSFTSCEDLIQFAKQHSILHHPYVQSRIFYLNQFRCKTCNKQFSSKKNLKHHTKLCILKKHCENCNQSFVPTLYEAHRVKCLTCKTCKKKCQTIQEFSSHTCSIFHCPYCKKTYFSQDNIQAHVRFCRSRPNCSNCKKYFSSQSQLDSHNCSLQCKKCNLHFPSRSDLENHFPTCQIKCVHCGKIFSTLSTLKVHKCQNNQVSSSGVVCRRCNFVCADRAALNLHIRAHHLMRGAGPIATPDIQDPQLRQCYEAHSSYINDEHVLGQVQSFYNWPLVNNDQFSLDGLCAHAESIYQDQSSTFKLNLSFGIILENIETGEFRYFRAYSNDPIFNSPLHISRKEDLIKLREKLSELDITQYIMKARPNTHWRPALVTNVRYYITSTGFPLGSPISLPPHVMQSKSVLTLLSPYNSNIPYDDNYCLFRSIALFLAGEDLYKREKSFYQHTLHHFHKFCEYMKQDFSNGVGLEYMHDVEKCFNFNINVFSLTTKDVAIPVYKSRSRFPSTLNLNINDNHLSFIKNMQSYCKKYQCINCDMLFKSVSSCKRHQLNCSLATAHKFPGGYHSFGSDIFSQLEEFGILVSPEDRFYDYFAVYDFESYLKRLKVDHDGKTCFTQEHKPISVSVCSNVPNYESPKCFVDPDPNNLIKSMLEYLTEIQQKAMDLIVEKFRYVFDQLDSLVLHWEEQDVEETHLFVKIMRQKLESLISSFEYFCSQLPVLGFNSARYDLNVIRPYICRHLEMDQAERAFTIKKNNAYSCISTHQFKFLDIINYLAVGTSYASFLKAFDIEEAKGFFPYSYLDDPSRLDETSLPPFDAFYSDLKGENVLGSEQNYIAIQQIWKDNNMQTLRQYLEYYNNLDVLPFVEAVSKLQELYKTKQIDMFKSSISVPGIARLLLYRCAEENDAKFALMDEKNKDLFFSIQNNLFGGPSIIFNREIKTGVTRIRNSTKLAKKILGFDANSLYLFCFTAEFPTGPFMRRRAENNFKPEHSNQYQDMYDYIDFLAHRENLTFFHKNNRGHEVRVGRYLCDAMAYVTDPNTGENKHVIVNFDGCRYHPHMGCKLYKMKPHCPIDRSRQQRTLHRDRYCERMGYIVHRIRECEYQEMKRNSPELKKFIESRKPAYYKPYKNSLSQEEILAGVRSGELFGMVEVDISIPSSWEGEFKKDLSPYEYFSEMSPLFCTTLVEFKDIGEHMQEHIKKFNLSQKPRKLLVGGMKAKKLLLATPLLRWYLNHGLQVSKIYQTVEFTPKACFKNFVRDVTAARRAGDISPAKSLFADLNKLIGNASYGSTMVNKMKHHEVRYVQGEDQACMQANSNRFKRMTQLDENFDFFEIEKQKRSITLDTPCQIAHFILQLAKLRMLEFYYDCLDYFLDRKDFVLAQCDTDSLYLAISGDNLEDVVKPERKAEFQNNIYNLCSEVHSEANSTNRFLPRKCCQKHQEHDRREPGLFKIEHNDGLDFIGLCSKTYIVRNEDFVKFSSKGLSKKRITNVFDKFQQVLNSRESIASCNKGIVAKDCSVFTYSQMRNGFTYLYVKRKVCNDGVSTEPLDIWLTPINKYPQLFTN